MQKYISKTAANFDLKNSSVLLYDFVFCIGGAHSPKRRDIRLLIVYIPVECHEWGQILGQFYFSFKVIMG